MLAVGIKGKMKMTSPGRVNVSGPSGGELHCQGSEEKDLLRGCSRVQVGPPALATDPRSTCSASTGCTPQWLGLKDRGGQVASLSRGREKQYSKTTPAVSPILCEHTEE